MPPKERRKSSGAKEKEDKKSEKDTRCLYCKTKTVIKGSRNLRVHIRKHHKDIKIRCDNRQCVTYFHTEEEKKKHNEQVHEKSRERGKYPCFVCDKDFGKSCIYRKHVKGVHEEFPLKCLFRGCFLYFKTQIELKRHFESEHKKDEESKTHECPEFGCGYKAKTKGNLNRHIELSHGKESWECDICRKEFPSERSLAKHKNDFHEFKKCKICKMSVIVTRMATHLIQKICVSCNKGFDCSGLLKKHKRNCKPYP